MVVPVLYNNGNETRDFVDCTIKNGQYLSEHNETPLKIKSESVLVPFSEYIKKVGKYFLNKFINML